MGGKARQIIDNSMDEVGGWFFWWWWWCNLNLIIIKALLHSKTQPNMPISQSTNLPVRTIGRPPDDEWLRVKWTEHSLCARPRPPSLPLPLRDPGPDSLTPHSRQHAVSIQILPLQGYCMRHKGDRRTAQKGGARGEQGPT